MHIAIPEKIRYNNNKFSLPEVMVMASARMTEVYEKLYKAVCNQSTNNVVTAAYEIFGKPVLFVDEYFHVVSMHPSSPIGIPQWDSIYQNKALNREQILRTLDEFLSGKKAFYEPFYAATGSCEQSPLLFAEVVQDNTVHGHIIVFWDGTPPTDEDYEIIGLVLDAIRLRISSRIKSMGTWNLALSTKLMDLLAPSTPSGAAGLRGHLRHHAAGLHHLCHHHRRLGLPARLCRVRRPGAAATLPQRDLCDL